MMDALNHLSENQTEPKVILQRQPPDRAKTTVNAPSSTEARAVLLHTIAGTNLVVYKLGSDRIVRSRSSRLGTELYYSDMHRITSEFYECSFADVE